MDIALGLILLVVAYVLRSERMEQRRERKKKEKEGVEKGPSRVERVLGRGSARITFLVGVALTLPGVAYLAALHELDKLNYGTVPTILVILGFNAMLLILLEIPLIGYVVAPERTVVAVQDFRAWLSRNGLKAGIYVAAGLGAAADRPWRDRVPHLSRAPHSLERLDAEQLERDGLALQRLGERPSSLVLVVGVHPAMWVSTWGRSPPGGTVPPPCEETSWIPASSRAPRASAGSAGSVRNWTLYSGTGRP